MPLHIKKKNDESQRSHGIKISSLNMRLLFPLSVYSKANTSINELKAQNTSIINKLIKRTLITLSLMWIISLESLNNMEN